MISNSNLAREAVSSGVAVHDVHDAVVDNTAAVWMLSSAGHSAAALYDVGCGYNKQSS